MLVFVLGWVCGLSLRDLLNGGWVWFVVGGLFGCVVFVELSC